MSTPLQKPSPLQKSLLLPGIAPHLFQSRRPHKTVKTSPSRRTAAAHVQTQAAEITFLTPYTADLYHESQRQLMKAITHLNTILTFYAETGNEGGLEGAVKAARAFVQELIDANGSFPGIAPHPKTVETSSSPCATAGLVQTAEISLASHVETEQQLLRAIIHLNIILVYAETGNERGLEGAVTAARGFGELEEALASPSSSFTAAKPATAHLGI
ncbi:hypothetical protein GGX14DRAFT_672072 [Mycena pura]|uniref:Uncharacterized protein n=1 Tax=Mycena pura TaxID=153505 RepID=A0AAD6V139_9AGAR|nr:hypothetical protein GGX14DRAFT_672072 [Mycena pura]